MAIDFIDGTGLWETTTGVAPPIPPPAPPAVGVSHSPGNWRTANPRIRKMLLRGILPKEFEQIDIDELEEITKLLDDLDNLPI